MLQGRSGARNGAMAVLALAVFAATGALRAQDDAPDPDAAGEEAPETPAAPALPPAKRVDGTLRDLVVALDGSAVAVAVDVGKNEYEVWHFEADAPEGRRIQTSDDWISDLVLTPNGRFAAFHTRSDGARGREIQIRAVDVRELRTHRIPALLGDFESPTLESGPGDTQITVSASSTWFVYDVAARERLPPPSNVVPSEEESYRERVKAVSPDGTLDALMDGDDVVLQRGREGEQVMRIEVDGSSRKSMRYDPVGFSADASVLLLLAAKATGGDKVTVEGWDIATQRRSWSVPAPRHPHDLIVGGERVVTLVDGRVKLYDVATGRPCKLPPIPKPVVRIGTDRERRVFWVATVDGRVFPLEER